MDFMHSQMETVKEVRPTRFLGVPRIWEKIVEKLVESERKNTGAKKILLDWAKAQAAEHKDNCIKYGPDHKPSMSYKLAHKLVLR